MPKLESIFIESFRGLRNLQLKELGRINLLVGVNNSGKTSLLEALSIYSQPLDLREWWIISSQREREDRFVRSSILDSFQWLFPQESISTEKTALDQEFHTGKISISSSGSFPISNLLSTYTIIEELRIPRRRFAGGEDEDDSAELVNGLDMQIEVTPTIGGMDNQLSLDLPIQDESSRGVSINGNQLRLQIWEGESSIRLPRLRRYNVPIETVTPVSHRIESHQFRLLSEARYQNFKGDVVDLLSRVDCNIKDIEILTDPKSVSSRNQFSIYIQHEKLGLAPLATFGDGIRRLLHIALKMVRVRGGILLIDEIESTIHTEALQSSYSWLAKWCEEMDVQIFATTHSLEAVDALLEVTNSEDDLVLYRLEPDENETHVTRHAWSRLKVLREELGQEVRW